MASYTNEFSRLPSEIMTRHYFKDIDNTVANEVNQIKILQAQGQYDKVNEIIANNPSLKQYVFGADDFNAIDEETRNLEILAKSKKQQIYYTDDEPDYAVAQDIWIGS